MASLTFGEAAQALYVVVCGRNMVEVAALEGGDCALNHGKLQNRVCISNLSLVVEHNQDLQDYSKNAG